MNRKDRGLIIGTLLGDSSIAQNNPSGKNKNTYYIFQFCHEKKQRSYAFYKALRICKMFNRQYREPNFYSAVTNFGKVDYYRFSMSHKYFKQLRRLLYPNGKKFFSERILNYLTPEGIAMWYMDDGYVSKKLNKEKQQLVAEMRLATFCSLEEAENIISYFQNNWGITMKKRFHKKTSLYYMAICSNECLKLEQLIGSFILPDLRYKLPSFYNPRVQDTLPISMEG